MRLRPAKAAARDGRAEVVAAAGVVLDLGAWRRGSRPRSAAFMSVCVGIVRASRRLRRLARGYRYTLESLEVVHRSAAMITITDKGAEKVHEFLAAQQADLSVAGLRVGVRGGGCSGFQYQLAFDEQRDNDVVFESHGLKLLVDGESLQFVRGSTSTTRKASRAPASRSRTRTSSPPAAAAPPSGSPRRSRSRPSEAGRARALSPLPARLPVLPAAVRGLHARPPARRAAPARARARPRA